MFGGGRWQKRGCEEVGGGEVRSREEVEVEEADGLKCEREREVAMRMRWNKLGVRMERTIGRN